MNYARRVIGCFLLALCAYSPVVAASSGSGAKHSASTASSSDLGWPRRYSDGAATLVLYQPQVDSWTDFKKLSARSAISLTVHKGAPPVWGVLTIASDTLTDLKARTVTFENFTVTGVTYPTAPDDAATKAWRDLTTSLLPAHPSTVALDRIEAYLDENQVKLRQAGVLLDPPPILVSRQPAMLVIIDGAPALVPVEGTGLQRIVNTNWDLFFDKSSSRYYLHDDKAWLSAKDLKDAWTPVAKLPSDFSKLPATDAYKELHQSIAKPHKPAVVKLVLVVDKPTELIVVAGDPVFASIPDTSLMWVTNTECDIFFDTAANQFYFLTSGRWFRSPELKSNGWTAATTSLPPDFLKIPSNHPRAHVLASIPGTREAEDAVVLASTPQTATIDRKTVKAEVKYVGEPKFEPIADTGVSYASNSPNDVFHVGDSYYLCLDGVWFVAQNAAGPWQASDTVPTEIYSIPPSSPKYNVTYVTVQESSPDTVTYSYTAGYTGIYVGYGVAMWGTGYYYPPYLAYGYYPYPVYWPYPYYTYGASAWYNPATGVYGRGSAVYGPYGGYARGAAFNPATGAYAWGRGAWGPYGAAAAGGFYNPSTGAWGAGYRASNGYQSWGQSVVGRNGQTARTASYSDQRGTVAAAQTSGGGKVVAARGSQGEGFAGKSAAGDFYAGRDGNVYKRDQSGQWYKNNGGSWENVNRAAQGGGPDRSARSSATQAGGAGRESVQGGLNRDASARSHGNYNTQRADTARKSSGWTSGGFVGHRSSGWAVRSPGFGGRR